MLVIAFPEPSVVKVTSEAVIFSSNKLPKFVTLSTVCVCPSLFTVITPLEIVTFPPVFTPPRAEPAAGRV